MDVAEQASLQQTFAAIVNELMNDELSTAEAVWQFQSACMEEVAQLRWGGVPPTACACAPACPHSMCTSASRPAHAAPACAPLPAAFVLHSATASLLPGAGPQALRDHPLPCPGPPVRRQQASAARHKAASYLQLRKLADELEAQAATWHLLLQLYCAGDMPAGFGGPQPDDLGGRRTYRQMLRDAVTDDPLLLRWGWAACAALCVKLR